MLHISLSTINLVSSLFPTSETHSSLCPEDQILFSLPSIFWTTFLFFTSPLHFLAAAILTNFIFLPTLLPPTPSSSPSLVQPFGSNPSSVSFPPLRTSVVHRPCGQITTDPPAEATAPVRVHRDYRSSTQTCTPMIFTMLNHRMIIGPDTILATTTGEPMTAVHDRPGTGRPIDLPTAALSTAMVTAVEPLPSPEPMSPPSPPTATVFVSP